MRDLRNIGYSKNNYPDLCYYYDKQYVQNNEVVKDAKPLGRFYKKDKIAFEWRKIQTGDGTFSNDYFFVGTIETPDHVEDLRVGMYVVIQTGMLFRVESPIISDDANKSKVIGKRPSVITTMTLKGVESRR